LGGIPTARYAPLRGVQRSRKVLLVLPAFAGTDRMPVADDGRKSWFRDANRLAMPWEREVTTPARAHFFKWIGYQNDYQHSTQSLRAARQFGHEIDKRIYSSRAPLIG